MREAEEADDARLALGCSEERAPRLGRVGTAAGLDREGHRVVETAVECAQRLRGERLGAGALPLAVRDAPLVQGHGGDGREDRGRERKGTDEPQEPAAGRALALRLGLPRALLLELLPPGEDRLGEDV